jgi:hypothetical protein
MKPLTLDELAGEVRQGRTPPFEAWAEARAYERSLFPADTHWPLEYEIYECVTDCRTAFLTHWHTAFTGGGEAKILVGDRIRIQEVVDSQPVVIAAVPVARAEVEARIIPIQDREHPQYAGYSLSLRTRDLISNFRLWT